MKIRRISWIFSLFFVFLLSCGISATREQEDSEQKKQTTSGEKSKKTKKSARKEKEKKEKKEKDIGDAKLADGEYLLMDAKDLYGRSGSVLLGEDFLAEAFFPDVRVPDAMVVKEDSVILATRISDDRPGLFSIAKRDWQYIPDFHAYVFEYQDEHGETFYRFWENFDHVLYTGERLDVLRSFICNSLGESIAIVPDGNIRKVGNYLWISEEMGGDYYGIIREHIFDLHGQPIRTLEAPEGYHFENDIWEDFIPEEKVAGEILYLSNDEEVTMGILYSPSGEILADFEDLRAGIYAQGAELGHDFQNDRIYPQTYAQNLGLIIFRTVDHKWDGVEILVDQNSGKILEMTAEGSMHSYGEANGKYYLAWETMLDVYQLYTEGGTKIGEPFPAAKSNILGIEYNEPPMQLVLENDSLSIKNLLTGESLALEGTDPEILRRIQETWNQEEGEMIYLESEGEGLIIVSVSDTEVFYRNGKAIMQGDVSAYSSGIYCYTEDGDQDTVFLQFEQQEDMQDRYGGNVWLEKEALWIDAQGETVAHLKDLDATGKTLIGFCEKFYMVEHGNYLEFCAYETNEVLHRMLYEGDD